MIAITIINSSKLKPRSSLIRSLQLTIEKPLHHSVFFTKTRTLSFKSLVGFAANFNAPDIAGSFLHRIGYSRHLVVNPEWPNLRPIFRVSNPGMNPVCGYSTTALRAARNMPVEVLKH
jgi:hypothetical protein